jgi:type II secretory pathway component PulM
MGIVVSGLVSIAIAAFIYFVIVKPETDRANDTVKQSLQQAQPSINRAAHDAKQAEKQAKPSLDRAARIQQCVANAGTDPQKLAACNK